MFKWSGQFETGESVIDQQHKRLVGILNELYAAVEADRVTEGLLDDMLTRLMDYAGEHFADEEALAIRRGVDERHQSLHHMEHQSFIYDISRVRADYSPDEGLKQHAERLCMVVTAWLTYHILGTDVILTRQMQAIAGGMAAEEAFETYRDAEHDAATTRIILGAVITMWRHASRRCALLEERLEALGAEC